MNSTRVGGMEEVDESSDGSYLSFFLLDAGVVSRGEKIVVLW